MLGNTLKRFGIMTKLLHWLIFLLIIAQFYFVWSLPENSPLTPLYIMLHKSVGSTILILGIIFLIWHIINIKPLPPTTQPRWQYIISKAVHHILFLLIILMPIVGYLMTCADGKPINFFGLFYIPCFIAKNDYLGSLMFSTHQKMAYLLLILVAIHCLAALYHHFIGKDNVLTRMLPFRLGK